MYELTVYDMYCRNTALDGSSFPVIANGQSVTVQAACFKSISHCSGHEDCHQFNAPGQNDYCCGIYYDPMNVAASKMQCLPTKLDKTIVTSPNSLGVATKYNAYCTTDLQGCSKNSDCYNIGDDYCCADISTTINSTIFQTQGCANSANNSKNIVHPVNNLTFTVSCNGLPCKNGSQCDQYVNGGPDLCCADITLNQWGYNSSDRQCVSTSANNTKFNI